MPGTRRTLARLTSALLAASCLCGCLVYDETIEARPDGSGTITFHYKIPVLLVGFTGRSNPDAIVPLSFDEAELRALLDGASLRPSSLEVYDADAERHVRLVIELGSIEDLKRLPPIRGHRLDFESDRDSGDWIFRRSIRLAAADASLGPFSWAGLELGRLRFSCRLPWTLRETNADGSRDGTLHWERRLADLAAEPFVMSVRVAPPSVLALVIGHPAAWGALGIMMLGGAGFAAVRLRRRKTG